MSFLFRHLRRILLILAVLLILLVVAEVTARLFAPFYSSRHLVASTAADGTPVWIDNPFFAYRFEPPRTATPPLPVVATQERTPGSIRIVLLADDAGLGEPAPSFGLARVLEALLQARVPTSNVEVIPLGLVGGNSHTLRESARDLGRLRPDAVILLFGNNEIAGPFGPASLSGRLHTSSSIARFLTVLSRTHLHQLYVDCRNRFLPRIADREAWKSVEPLTLRDRLQLDDPRLSSTHRAFQKNYDDILGLALDAASVVVPVTVPVNLRDCSPFATAYLRDETQAQNVRELFRAAIKATDAGDLEAAAAQYDSLFALNPRHAEALFRAADVQLALGHVSAADALYRRAADSDALPLRASPAFNQIIREAAAARNLPLYDADHLFATLATNGIPGHDLFLDHIHYNFTATYALASALLDTLQSYPLFAALLPPPRQRHTPPPPDELATFLLENPWGELSMTDTIIHQQLSQPFLRQTTHTRTLTHLRALRDAAQARVDAIPLRQVHAIFARRQEARPRDIAFSALVAYNVFRAGDPARAETAARAALDVAPHRYDLRALLAFILAAQDRPFDQVLPLLRTPAGHDGYFDVRAAIQVADYLLGANLPAQAIPWLRYALGRDPSNSSASVLLAQAFYRTSAPDDAVETLKTAIERTPQNPILWEELSGIYCLVDEWDLANDAFNKAELIAPYRYKRLYMLADALIRLRQYSRAASPLRRYLSAVPEDPDALRLQTILDEHLPPSAPPTNAPSTNTASRPFWQ